MNFIDAAITVLREHGRPTHVEELCRVAVERGLLSKPGANPLRSMKGRLTTEAKKPDAGVVRVDGDVWSLRDLEGGGAAAADEPRADEMPAADTTMTPEERRLIELYEDETGATTPVAELTEYRDEHTDDEDRQLLPEIVAKGRGRPPPRKGRRGGREEKERAAPDGARRARGERRRRERAPTSAPEGAAAAEAPRTETAPTVAPEAEAVQVVAPAPEPAGALRLRPGSPLADAAYETLAELKNGQPMQVKQLAQMMRKRRRLEGDPQAMWAVIKAALLTDEQQHRARGLRPRVVHRGRDLFGAATRGLPDDLARAERALEAAHIDVLSATLRELGNWLSALDVPALERLVHIYLEREGWGEIRWIKRAGRSGYALAEPSDIPGPVLVGVRAGDAPVDRRGVGELRAGLDAKDLPRGMLLAPQELSDEARSELDRRGRPVHPLVGARMVRAMASSGIGVVSTSVPIQYLDVELFAELAEE